MTSSPERSSSIFSTPSAGRRILHRIASPFAQKTRSISEFAVKAHDPHKQYSPGETVKGAVIVKVVKPLRVTHVSVCLHGFVQVHKTPGSPAESVRGYSSRIGKTAGKKSGQYFGNGFASLFEDETVVCGDGRLAEGLYQFEFEVTFPKDIGLPSSIEFERGTISYMVTATLTRPTTMNPTISHDQRLFLCERIDIATLLPPKSRTITLEPVSKRSRPRTHSKKLPLDGQTRAGTSSLSARTQESAISSNLPSTPSVSDASLDSRVSSSAGRMSVNGSTCQSQRTSDSINRLNNVLSPAEKTITATVESLRGGCLRGDSIPIRVLVSHTKHVKSMNGVMITLYRVARVDLHPALPIGPMTDGQKRKYEDYYPRSLTGLGGLSLSGTGSSHVFRKDLSQTIVPMIVDPQTLKSEINAKVRVPEDAFPTINTVPGSMISFRYYVEVVLDIQGKLAGNDKFFSQRPGGSTYGGHLGSPIDANGPAGGDGSSPFVLQGPGVLDTAPIRRDTSVVTSVFEVVVGTLDSDRRKGKARAQTPPEDEHIIDTSHLIQSGTPAQAATQPYQSPQHHHGPYDHPDWYGWDPNAESSSGWANYPEEHRPTGYDDYFAYDGGDYQNYDGYNGMSQHVPPPPTENEGDLSEKERLRRAEAHLMPSQPPEAVLNLSSDVEAPSAPIIPEEYSHTPPENVIAGPSRAAGRHLEISTHSTADVASHEPHLPLWSGSIVETESNRSEIDSKQYDKQELQRRQLQQAASAPPATASEEVANVGAESSVPSLGENASDGFEAMGPGQRVENLPRYFR